MFIHVFCLYFLLGFLRSGWPVLGVVEPSLVSAELLGRGELES